MTPTCSAGPSSTGSRRGPPESPRQASAFGCSLVPIPPAQTWTDGSGEGVNAAAQASAEWMVTVASCRTSVREEASPEAVPVRPQPRITDTVPAAGAPASAPASGWTGTSTGAARRSSATSAVKLWCA